MNNINMNNINMNNMSFLDKVMHTRGIYELQNFFNQLTKQDPEQASKLVNDEHLHFSVLFVLQSEFRESDLYTCLNSRNIHALELAHSILSRQTINKDRLSSDYSHTTFSVLKWMLETGYIDDGLNNQYDEVMETSAVLLVKSFKDDTILPIIAEMIFNRYRKGLFIYDLVWAFFEARNPRSLILIANSLRSTQLKDVELSQKLLAFIPCITMNSNIDPTSLYSCCIHWIEENSIFLYYTGESFQQTCSPMFYTMSSEAKYLCKGISTDSRRYLMPLTASEYNLLEQFNKLSHSAKTLLSEYSFWLYRQDLNLWNQWRSHPVLTQLNAVKDLVGGLS